MATLLVVVYGLVAGSFVGLCAYRLPRGLSVARPGSRCPACGHTLAAWENLPLVSYLALGGRCRGCRARIGWGYPLAEILTAAGFAWAWRRHAGGAEFVREALFLSLLVALAVTDAETRQLPDELTLGGWAAGLVFAVWTAPGIVSAAWASAVGAGFLALVGVGYQRWRGRPGMGWGDVKMLGLLGAFLGAEGAAVALFVAAVSAAAVGVAQAAAMLVRTRSRLRTAVYVARGTLPFGVFLAGAGAAALAWGAPIWRAWLG